MRGAYDFETSGWTKPIALGLLWGPPDAREWSFQRDTLDAVRLVARGLEDMRLLSKFEGVSQWWAYNGGAFDALIMLEGAAELGWKIEAAPAMGGRIIRMTIRPAKGEKFELLDAMAVVPGGLNNACRDFGLKAQKLFTAENYSGDMARLSPKALEAGCRADCEAELELLETVDTHLQEWGGSLKATFSSSALTAAKHAAKESVGEWPITPVFANEFARDSYFGGRVEVFHHTPPGELREYDVTSSYPWSMSQPVPWELEEVLTAPKDLDWDGICQAEVDTPKGLDIPVLPVKDAHGGLYFPTGKWTGTYPVVELRYAASLGVKVRPLFGHRYKMESPFKAFIDKAFHLKNTSKGSTRAFAKFVLVGSYGKAAEKPEKEKIFIYETEAEGEKAYAAAVAEKRSAKLMRKGSARFQLHEVYHWPKHTNFALASYITARSRILLHGHLVAASLLAYCDTDSIHARKTEALEASVNEDLGGLKIEVKRLKAEYFAPKLYRLEDLDSGEAMLASKGFPVDAKAFAAIIKGERVFRDSFLKVKGQIRRAGNKFTRLEGANATFRTWGGKSVKRCPVPGGGTRPWSIDEIRSGAHLDAFSPLSKN